MIRRIRDVVIANVAVVVGLHIADLAVRMWLSWTAPRPVISPSVVGRVLDEMFGA